MLTEYSIKATFFVVADVIEHYHGLVERIATMVMKLPVTSFITPVKYTPGRKNH